MILLEIKGGILVGTRCHRTLVRQKFHWALPVRQLLPYTLENFYWFCSCRLQVFFLGWNWSRSQWAWRMHTGILATYLQPAQIEERLRRLNGGYVNLFCGRSVRCKQTMPVKWQIMFSLQNWYYVSSSACVHNAHNITA
jgi:hypothetical protein